MFYNKRIILLLFIFCMVGLFALSMFNIPLAQAEDTTPHLLGGTDQNAAGACLKQCEDKSGKDREGCVKGCYEKYPQYFGEYQLNDVLGMAEKIIDIILSVVGSLAFLFFIYGGLTLLFSGGSEERVKKGKGILVAAIIGLVIVFSSYLIIDYTFQSLGVERGWDTSGWFE